MKRIEETPNSDALVCEKASELFGVGHKDVDTECHALAIGIDGWKHDVLTPIQKLPVALLNCPLAFDDFGKFVELHETNGSLKICQSEVVPHSRVYEGAAF